FQNQPRRRSGMFAGSAQPSAARRHDGVGQVANLIARHVAPQTLQVVKAPPLFAEDVHYESPEIQQRPIRRTMALAMFGFAPQLLVKLFFYLSANRLHLRRAETGAEYKVFSECSEAAQVKHGNAGSFLVLHGLDGEAHGWRELFQIHLYRPCLRMYSSTRAETSP